MNLIEFIGFIISFLAFLYLMFRRVFEDISRNSRSPEELRRKTEMKQEQKLKEFLKSLEVDMEETEDYGEEPTPVRSLPSPIPPPKPALKPAPVPFQIKSYSEKKEEFHQPNIVSHRFQKNEHDPYKIQSRDEVATLKALLNRPQKQKLVIYKEIMDPPKSIYR